VLQLVVTLLEAFNAAGSVNQFLFTGKKRMAGGADLGVDFAFGGTGQKRVAAQTLYGYFGIHGVNAFFHLVLLLSLAAK
jgi:hypothetical protein